MAQPLREARPLHIPMVFAARSGTFSTMTPFFFGNRDRRLFGVMSPPTSPVRTRNATLLCGPFGQEYIRAHRSMRRLANQLSGAGHTVLRFDYFGTGDSYGASADVSIPGFLSDIRAAIDELKDVAEARFINVVGLRLGAMLVARSLATAGRDVGRVVLWDPVVNGRELMAEMAFAQRPPRPRASERGGGVEFMGFPWSGAFLEELAATDVRADLEALDLPVLAIYSKQPVPGPEGVLTLRRPDSSVRQVAAPAAWEKQSEFGAGAIPVAVIDAAVDWLGAALR